MSIENAHIFSLKSDEKLNIMQNAKNLRMMIYVGFACEVNPYFQSIFFFIVKFDVTITRSKKSQLSDLKH